MRVYELSIFIYKQNEKIGRCMTPQNFEDIIDNCLFCCISLRLLRTKAISTDKILDE